MVSSGGAPPRGSAAAAADMLRRRGAGSSSDEARAGYMADTIPEFYRDDTSGLAPTTVFIISLGFIALVVMLHAMKFYYSPES